MLHDARERYDVPVVEVIRPAVRRAVGATRTGRIGVISTVGTHQSRAYLDAFAAAPHLDVTSGACPRFVDFVEAGVTGGEEVRAVAREYLAPFQERDVDTLILGCTHYPLALRRDLLCHGPGRHARVLRRRDREGALPRALRRRPAPFRRLTGAPARLHHDG